MQRRSGVRTRILIAGVVVGALVAACGRDSGATMPGSYEDLAAPLLLGSVGRGDLETAWEKLTEAGVDLPRLGEDAGPIAAFEPFNDPRIALSDGRFVVRGRWESDAPIEGWIQRNPVLLPEGEDNPVTTTSRRPVRLFVYDPESGQLLPLSHIPAVHPCSTATSLGESADVVLAVVVLAGERAVGYTLGFNGAAYDIPREVYVASIPTR
jgi:hypothetical protein